MRQVLLRSSSKEYWDVTKDGNWVPLLAKATDKIKKSCKITQMWSVHSFKWFYIYQYCDFNSSRKSFLLDMYIKKFLEIMIINLVAFNSSKAKYHIYWPRNMLTSRPHLLGNHNHAAIKNWYWCSVLMFLIVKTSNNKSVVIIIWFCVSLDKKVETQPLIIYEGQWRNF